MRCLLSLVINRAHLYAGIETVADADGRSGVSEWSRGRFFVRFADRYGDGNGEAALAGAANALSLMILSGKLHVRIG